MRTGPGKNGFTQIELLIASVILAVGILSFIQAMRNAGVGVIKTNRRSTATQLSNSKMVSMRSMSFTRVLVTTAPVPIPDAPSGSFYDPGYYPPETICISGVDYKRYLLVERVERVSGTDDLVVLPPDSMDSGLKRITVVTTWKEGNELRQAKVFCLNETTDLSLTSLTLQGVVVSTAGVPIPGAQIVATYFEQMTVKYSGVDGHYQLQVSPGDVSVYAERQGYVVSATTGVSMSAANSPYHLNLTLEQCPTGSVKGAVWYNDRVVISQVAGDVFNAGTGVHQEYVELFNPTTWTWTVSGQLGLKFQRRTDPLPLPISVVYNSASISPGKFYLFANVSPVTVNGVSRTPDAVWNTNPGDSNYANFPYFGSDANIIPSTADGAGEGSGSVDLYQVATGALHDRVGWQGAGGQNPASAEGGPIPDTPGLEPGECYRRLSSTAGVSDTAGPAYDSGDNQWDFSPAPATSPPRNGSTSSLPVIAGVPGMNAWVYTSDGGTSLVQSTPSLSHPAYAAFELPEIGVGDWKINAFLGSLGGPVPNLQYVGTVGAHGVPISVTTGPPQGIHLFMNDSNSCSVVFGKVTNTLGQPLSDIMVGDPGFLTDALGNFTTTINPYLAVNTNSLPNPMFGSFSQGYAFPPGSVNGPMTVVLKGRARITGLVLNPDGSPLPEIGVALQSDPYNPRDKTASNGYFSFWLAEGVDNVFLFNYSSRSTPPSAPITVMLADAGQDIFSSTFVVRDIHADLGGSLFNGGELLTTGATIVAVPFTVILASTSPPNTGSYSGTYMANGRMDGSYSIQFPNSGTYNIYAYRTRMNGSTPVMDRIERLGVDVSTATPTQVDLSW